MILGAISAGDKQTVEAGEWILRIGGNAYDAMLACILAAPICEPIFTSLGGGGFMLSAKQGEEPIVYDFFVDVPTNKKDIGPEFFPIDVDFGTTTQEFHIGCGAAAIPGMVKGIWKIYKDLASLPFETIIQPALKYATKGIHLSPIQADFIKLLRPIFTSTESSRKLYTKGDKLIESSHLFTNYEYGKFLKEFAKKGSDLFYKGEIADIIEKLCIKHHGLIDKKELQNYQVQIRKPIYIEYKDYDIFTNSPPSSGGILTAFSLLLLNNENLETFGSKKYLEKLIESQEITTIFRSKYINDFLHRNGLENILKDNILLEAFKNNFHSRLNLWGNTTHISIIDRYGNGAGTTTTNGEACGHLIPECGIMLNNMLGEEDLNPHGFFKWDSGIRLPSMMAPTAVLKDKKLILLLGSAGSNRIRSAILQVIINHIVLKMPIQEAITASRVHFEKNTIFTEPPLRIELNGKLKELYEIKEFDDLNLFFGGVQAVTGNYTAGADPRRGAYFSIIK